MYYHLKSQRLPQCNEEYVNIFNLLIKQSHKQSVGAKFISSLEMPSYKTKRDCKEYFFTTEKNVESCLEQWMMNEKFELSCEGLLVYKQKIKGSWE